MDSRRSRRTIVDPEPTRSRRTAITKSSPPRKSPVATRKSPARKSPARKSPARKSPARKSPVREVTTRSRPKRAVETPVDVKNAKTKISPKTTTESVLKVSISPFDKKTSKTISKTTSTTTSTRVKVENQSNNKDSIDLAKVAASYRAAVQEKLERLSQRLTPTPSGSRRTDSRSVSRSIFDDDERRSRSEENSDVEKESAYENFEKYKPVFSESNTYLHRSEARNTLSNSEFGGSVGALLLIILWCFGGFFVQFICTRQLCDYKADRVEKLKSLGTYLNMEAGVLYIAYTWGVIIVSALPIGSIVRVSDRGNQTFVFNGFLTAVLTVSLIVACEYFGYPALKLITRNYQRLLSISIVNALTLSVWFYIRSKYVPVFRQNPFARSGRFLSDFFIGKEINPHWLEIVNIKLVLYRISIVAMLIFNGLFIYKNLKFTPLPESGANGTLTWIEAGWHTYETVAFDPVALLIATLLVVYALDLLVFESHLTNSFELQCEGVGACLILRYALYPHLSSLIAKYTLEHSIAGVPNWTLALIAILFMCGLCLKRGSNRVKHQYRLNAAHPKFSSTFEMVPSIYLTNYN